MRTSILAHRRSLVGREGASFVNLDPRWECNWYRYSTVFVSWHLDHWLQAEHELIAEIVLDFEFTQLMRAFRSGIISETTGEQVMTDLEKRGLSGGMRIRAGWAPLSTEVKI
jgi:hypothetical protein